MTISVLDRSQEPRADARQPARPGRRGGRRRTAVPGQRPGALVRRVADRRGVRQGAVHGLPGPGRLPRRRPRASRAVGCLGWRAVPPGSGDPPQASAWSSPQERGGRVAEQLRRRRRIAQANQPTPMTTITNRSTEMNLMNEEPGARADGRAPGRGAAVAARPPAGPCPPAQPQGRAGSAAGPSRPRPRPLTSESACTRRPRRPALPPRWRKTGRRAPHFLPRAAGVCLVNHPGAWLTRQISLAAGWLCLVRCRRHDPGVTCGPGSWLSAAWSCVTSAVRRLRPPAPPTPRTASDPPRTVGRGPVHLDHLRREREAPRLLRALQPRPPP